MVITVAIVYAITWIADLCDTIRKSRSRSRNQINIEAERLWFCRSINLLNLNIRAILTTIYFESISTTLIFIRSRTFTSCSTNAYIFAKDISCSIFYMTIYPLIVILGIFTSAKSNLDWTIYIELDCIP